MTAQALKNMKFNEHVLGMTATLYAKKLYTKALQYSIVYEKKQVKPLYHKKLKELKCKIMHG